MKRILSLLLSLTAFLWVLSAESLASAKAGKFLVTGNYDVSKIIPPAPAADSLTTLTDLETVYQVQQRRTAEQVFMANYFANDHVFQFDTVLGRWFEAVNLPLTAAFFEQIEADCSEICDLGKKIWTRSRPPLLDPRIHACVYLPKSGAYPSGHTNMAFVRAGILAELFPEKREQLRERAQLVAWSRIIGGVHHPSDTLGGRILGDYLVGELLKQEAFRQELEKVRAEIRRVEARQKSKK